MEVARVERRGTELMAAGTQLGVSYELRYRLSPEMLSLEPGLAHDYVMRWVNVPTLEVSQSSQTYEPLGSGLVRFRAGAFEADIRFDEHGYVVLYPGIAKRV
jgi:hypothetical protein